MVLVQSVELVHALLGISQTFQPIIVQDAMLIVLLVPEPLILNVLLVLGLLKISLLDHASAPLDIMQTLLETSVKDVDPYVQHVLTQLVALHALGLQEEEP